MADAGYGDCLNVSTKEVRMDRTETHGIIDETVEGGEGSLKTQEPYVPLLYQKREYILASAYLSGTETSCETTFPKGTLDYGPDD
jgi:hypothetical protein